MTRRTRLQYELQLYGRVVVAVLVHESSERLVGATILHECKECLVTSKKPLVVRASTRAEHELLLNQALTVLTVKLRNPTAAMGPIHMVPLALSMAKIAELSLDEPLAKQGPRALIVKAFELEYPGIADLVRQAMDMRGLIVVAEVCAEADARWLPNMAAPRARPP